MRMIYLPDDPLAALGRALFYVSYGYLIKWYQDHGVEFGSPKWMEIARPFDRIVSTWPVAFLIEEGDEFVGR